MSAEDIAWSCVATSQENIEAVMAKCGGGNPMHSMILSRAKLTGRVAMKNAMGMTAPNWIIFRKP